MYLVQNVAFIDAFRKFFVYGAFFTGTFDEIADFKIKSVVIISFTGYMFHKLYTPFAIIANVPLKAGLKHLKPKNSWVGEFYC
jgi:hypothetical protein